MLSRMDPTMLTIVLLLASSHLGLQADEPEDWPGFRGPTAMGVAEDDPRLPDQWSNTQHVRWVTEVPGRGWSCPIVSGGRVFLTAVVNDDEYEQPNKGLYSGMGRSKPPEGVHHWMVYCLDLDTGRILWKYEAHSGQPQVPRHPKNTYASETPVTDGQRVYALFGDVGLYCFDFEGQQLWSPSHRGEEIAAQLRCGGLAGDLRRPGDHGVRQPRRAVHCRLRRRNRRSNVGARPARRKHSCVLIDAARGPPRASGKTNNGRRSSPPTATAFAPTICSGNVLWELAGPTSNLIIPSPIAAHGMVYVTSGYVGDRDRPVYAIRPGAQGETSVGKEPAEHPHVAWFQPKAGPYNTSPIVYGDYYYTLLDRGFMTCHDARTGEEVYGKTRFPEGASFTSSPWAYNGKIFCLSEDGDTYVVEAGPEFKVIGTNRLDELCLATPAVADGKLLLRTASRLYCITQ